jgi:DNA-binding GntR family transcriptional regulator
VWPDVNETHARLHGAIVAAAGSPRIEAAHRALSGELRVFILQLEPLWSPERMATDHAALVAGLERTGPEMLRAHLRESAAALAAAQKDTGRTRHFPGTPAR